MSTFSRKRPSGPSSSGSYAYGPISTDSLEDGHEMLNINTPSLLDTPATSGQSSPAQSLEITDLSEPDISFIRFDTAPSLDLTNFRDAKTASVVSGTEPLLRPTKHPGSTESIKNRVSVRMRNILKKGNYLQGWRMGITLCAATAGTVFLINLILTVWATSTYGLKKGGLGTIQEGSCKETARLSLWLHLIINALSTFLLGASNYSMQCLASPTREEVNRAHHQNKWLDIAVPSVRNLTRISRHRIVLWWLLALSSVPLHLFYNSAVFSTLSSQEYTVYSASPDFFSQKTHNWSTPVQSSYDVYDQTSGYFRNTSTSTWQRLDNAACIKAYAQPFVSAHGDLLVLSATINSSTLIETLSVHYGFGPYNWICSGNQPAFQDGRCNTDYILKNASIWTVGGVNKMVLSVQYCLSRSVEEHCQVQFSIVIMGVVMVCNLLKAMCMLLALRQQKSRPLVTLGDAIEEFLSRPDRTTLLACLSDKNSFWDQRWVNTSSKWKKEGRRWFSSVSKRRWLVCNVLCIVTLITASVLLRMGLTNDALTDRSLSYLWQMGYGTVTSESMINWEMNGTRGLLLDVLVANLSQAILSFLFLTYNGLFTCMLLAEEWNGYAHERKPLRVTNPNGAQRSTYRLQLPYKYGIPLMIVSATLHWLVSQSLFLANVRAYDGMAEDEEDSISTVGYSCIAIITVIILGAVVILVGLLNGFRRQEGMPLARSCSAAISAACHRPEEDVDAAIKPVMWGVVSSENGVGHCCFTSFEVSKPIQGELYAGLKAKDD